MAMLKNTALMSSLGVRSTVQTNKIHEKMVYSRNNKKSQVIDNQFLIPSVLNNKPTFSYPSMGKIMQMLDK